MKNHIYLIEDELDIMFVYKTALKAADINAETFSDGKSVMAKIKAIQAEKEPKPSLILLDLVLPDINGLEILRAIRENEITKDIVVYILSNYSSDALHNMEYIKPDKFLLKSSITPTHLVELVKEQLAK